MAGGFFLLVHRPARRKHQAERTRLATAGNSGVLRLERIALSISRNRHVRGSPYVLVNAVDDLAVELVYRFAVDHVLDEYANSPIKSDWIEIAHRDGPHRVTYLHDADGIVEISPSLRSRISICWKNREYGIYNSRTTLCNVALAPLYRTEQPQNPFFGVRAQPIHLVGQVVERVARDRRRLAFGGCRRDRARPRRDRRGYKSICRQGAEGRYRLV